jgi:hypothetical protein
MHIEYLWQILTPSNRRIIRAVSVALVAGPALLGGGSAAAAGVAASQEPQGYFVLQNTDSLEPVATSTLRDPAVAGVVLRRRWSDVNPSAGSYDWSYFDSQISRAKSFGKKVQLVVFTGVSAPNWLYAAGAQPLNFTDSRESQRTFTMPVPWDPVMLKYWKDCVAAQGARYDNDPTVTMVYAAGPCRFSCEMYIPEQATKLSSYSLPTLINAWTQCINDYNASFHATAISFNLSHAVDDSDGVPQAVAANATHILGSRATLQQDSLSAKTSNSYDVEALLVSYSKKGTRIGYEMLCPSSEHRFGGAFYAAVSIARAAGAQFINIYQADEANLKSPY